MKNLSDINQIHSLPWFRKLSIKSSNPKNQSSDNV